MSKFCKFFSRKYISIILYIFIASIIILIKNHALNLPIPPDVAEYGYMGKQILAGKLVYVDIAGMIPPGTPLLFSIWIKFFGYKPDSLILLGTFFHLTILTSIFFIGYKLFGLIPATIGSLYYTLVSGDIYTLSITINPETFITLFAIISILLIYFYTQKRKNIYILLSGIFISLTVFIKTTAIPILLIFSFFVFFIDFKKEKKIYFLNSFVRLLIFSTPTLTIWISLFIVYYLLGNFNELFSSIIGSPMNYSTISISRFLLFFKSMFSLKGTYSIWIIGSIYAVYLIFRKKNQLQLILLLYFLSNVISINITGRYWPHYYYLGLVPLIFLSMDLFNLILHKENLKRFPIIFLSIILIFLFVPTFITQYKTYYSKTPEDINNEIHPQYINNIFTRDLGQTIYYMTYKDDKIYTFTPDVNIYLYSKRDSASFYTSDGFITYGSKETIEKAKPRLIEELIKNKCKIIITSDIYYDPKINFHELYDLLNSRYQLIFKYKHYSVFELKNA